MKQVPPDDDGARLDRWIKKHFPDVPFGVVQKLLRTGQVRVDGKRAKADTRLVAGQNLRLPPALSKAKSPQESSAQDHAYIRSFVLYEDNDLVIINKPAGLAVQGGSGIKRHVDGMLDGLSGKGGVRARLTHRLDKDTSGVLLLARSAEVARRMHDIFAGRDIEKIYNALCTPAPQDDAGRIDAPLAKGMAGPNLEKMMIDAEAGKSALTDYTVLQRAADNGAAIVEFHPLTGRTHQIRVHAAHIGAPLWGDGKYGASTGKRFYLHARTLRLNHPRTGKKLEIHAPLPKAFIDQACQLGCPL